MHLGICRQRIVCYTDKQVALVWAEVLLRGLPASWFCVHVCLWMLEGWWVSGVFGYVCSAWVVCGMRDLGLGLAALGAGAWTACAWRCVRDGFLFGLRGWASAYGCGCGISAVFSYSCCLCAWSRELVPAPSLLSL